MKTLVRWVCALVLAVPASLPAALEVQDELKYSQADLDRILAPIALYPDTVLSHIMIASTYPLEVAQAARWSRQHPDLKGEQAVDAVEDKSWDPSVKALVAFPEILARMDEDLEWTEQLGHAFLAQEGQVMDSVQHLRRRAHEAGNLDSSEHVRVIREREVIYIEPALRHIIYLPYYDPWVVYGSWWWPAYPPYRWSYWDGHPVAYYGSGFYWGIGFHVAPVFYFSGFHWHNRHVVVIPHHRHGHSSWTSSRDVVRHSDAQRWQHDSRHRRGVEYRSPRLNRDYGHSASARDNDRRDPARVQQAVRHENQRRPEADGRRDFSSGSVERGQRGAEREAREERPRSETRTATVSEREENSRRGSTHAESNGPRERERQAQKPEREPKHEQRSSRDEAESGRNSRREPAPENSRGNRSERANSAPSRNNRGEDRGGRDSRQRGNER